MSNITNDEDEQLNEGKTTQSTSPMFHSYNQIKREPSHRYLNTYSKITKTYN
jgi:hypothetical protein